MNRTTLFYAMVCTFVGAVFAGPAASQDSGIDWSSTQEGAGGGVSAFVTSDSILGSIGTATFLPNDPDFVEEYGASLSRLEFFSDPTNGVGGDVRSVIEFIPALPLGSRLITFDVDVNQETLFLGTEAGPLTLVEQVETTAPTSSIFPAYNVLTGALVGLGNNNSNEASVFDVGGVSSLDVDFANGNSGSGASISIIVPEPTFLVQLALGVVALTGLRRRLSFF